MPLTGRKSGYATAFALVLIGGVGAWLSACGFRGESAEELSASLVRLVVDKSEPKRLLAYYFGGYLSPAAGDPFEAGMVEERGGRFYVNLDTLELHFAGAAALLSEAVGDDRIDWDELEAFVQETYYDARSAPPTFQELSELAGFAEQDADWLSVEVDGVVTTARRRIHVRRTAIRDALEKYHENEGTVIYPVGTTIIAEHVQGEERLEATVMRKRDDGYWDFLTYDASDSLAGTTSTPPRELRSPVQCVGCHFGSKTFEPEKSFPARAEPGPHGPRQVYVDEDLRSAEVVRFFDEHRKRSDTVLGLYSTLFVADLKSRERNGELDEESAALLQTLGLCCLN